MRELRVLPVRGLKEVAAGDDVAALIADAIELAERDVVVVAQKIVSKAEGRVLRLAEIDPGEHARELAGDREDARKLEAILRESARLVRVRPPLIVAETRHGFICGSAGVDASNAPEEGTVVLLPVVPIRHGRPKESVSYTHLTLPTKA